MTYPHATQSPAKRKNPAFTLIELLVVIAIIAILMAILLPVVGGIQRKAGTTETLSNLRQVHTLFITYAQDHNGTWPAPRIGDSGPVWSKDGLFRYLKPGSTGTPTWADLKDTIFTSPNAPATGQKDNPAAPTVVNASNQGFGMNTHLPDSDQPEGGYGEARQGRSLLLSMHSKTMLLMDSNAAILFGAPWFRDQFTTFVKERHKDRNTVLFCDGHVEIIEHARFDAAHPQALLPWNAAPGSEASLFWRGH